MALTDKQRREIENVHSMTVDVGRRLSNAITAAERGLPTGPAIAGFLRDAEKQVDFALDILSEMTRRLADDAT